MSIYNEKQFTFRIAPDSRIAVIDFIDERIDLANGPTIKDKLIALMDRHSLSHLILCLGKVQFIDSKGLASIISLWKFAASKGEGIVISIAGCSPPIEHFLTMCKLDHIFRIYPGEAEALAALRS